MEEVEREKNRWDKKLNKERAVENSRDVWYKKKNDEERGESVKYRECAERRDSDGVEGEVGPSIIFLYTYRYCNLTGKTYWFFLN